LLIIHPSDFSKDFAEKVPWLKKWLSEREHSPRRLVFGPEKDKGKKFSYIAWLPHGGYHYSHSIPGPLMAVFRSGSKYFTSIRHAALGIDDTYVLIWEDGTLDVALKDHYTGLGQILNLWKDWADCIEVRLSLLLRL
jgi:hypothetical protein